MRRRRRLGIAAAAVLALAVASALVVRAVRPGPPPPVPVCLVGHGPNPLVLTPEQAANATTIAVVARRMGLPDHAVTVALATALQESKLHNYPFGDRDSLGLFQQRPSQGWGRPAQLLTPSYAAAAFYRHLVRVPGWRHDSVAVAAQAVQHSFDGSLYAQWEEPARVLAVALTGEVPAGLACTFPPPRTGQPSTLRALGREELGRGRLALAAAPRARSDAWAVASWLVGHAYGYGVTRVSVLGRTWRPQRAEWQRDPRAGDTLTFDVAASRRR